MCDNGLLYMTPWGRLMAGFFSMIPLAPFPVLCMDLNPGRYLCQPSILILFLMHVTHSYLRKVFSESFK